MRFGLILSTLCDIVKSQKCKGSVRNQHSVLFPQFRVLTIKLVDCDFSIRFCTKCMPIINGYLFLWFGFQDYKEAARLRDSLRLFVEEDPVLRLHGLMKEAIADERFQVPHTKLLMLKLLIQFRTALAACTKTVLYL